MSGKTHVICGTTALMTIAIKYPDILQTFGTDVSPLWGLVSVAAFSKIPDIDLATTEYGRKYSFFSKIFTHRGMTHTLLFPAILAVIMELFAVLSLSSTGKVQEILFNILTAIMFGAVVGWLAHIVADSFNKKGVPVFWPFRHDKYHLPLMKFKSNNPKHEFIFLCLWIGGLVWLSIL